jgi:outer membrane receptor protein involved in Fe transport
MRLRFLDAQVNYGIPKLKSTLKIGAANLGGKEYQQVLGAGANRTTIFCFLDDYTLIHY